MRNYIIKLLYLLVLIYPWGRFFDKLLFYDVQQGTRGISTMVILVIVIFGISSKYFAKGFIRIPKKIFVLIFFVLTFFATIFSTAPEKILSDFVNLVVYFLIIFTIVGVAPSFREITRMVKLLLFSTVVMACLALLDYLEFVNVPHFNEGVSNIFVGNSYVFDLTGPFLIRTEIGFHLALIFFVPLLFIFQKKPSFLSKCAYIFMFLILLITAYLSNSRAIFFSLAFGICYFVLLQLRRTKKLILMVVISLLGLVLLTVDYDFIAETNLFTRNIGSDSDLIRFYAFASTIEDVLESPIGAGLDRPFIQEINQYKDVHNSFTYLLRAGGFMGFVSLILFFRPLLKKIFRFQVSLDESIVVFPILSLSIYGIWHTSIQVPTFWVLTGLAFSIYFYQKKIINI